MAAEKCPRNRVVQRTAMLDHYLARGRQQWIQSGITGGCFRAAALKMKWHLEGAFHLALGTFVLDSCALQSQLTHRTLMMLSSGDGD